jgi:hypothetical protein
MTHATHHTHATPSNSLHHRYFFYKEMPLLRMYYLAAMLLCVLACLATCGWQVTMLLHATFETTSSFPPLIWIKISDVWLLLSRIRSSGARYLLVSSHDCLTNSDALLSSGGHYRPVNILRQPFSDLFPAHLLPAATLGSWSQVMDPSAFQWVGVSFCCLCACVCMVQ